MVRPTLYERPHPDQVVDELNQTRFALEDIGTDASTYSAFVWTGGIQSLTDLSWAAIADAEGLDPASAHVLGVCAAHPDLACPHSRVLWIESNCPWLLPTGEKMHADCAPNCQRMLEECGADAWRNIWASAPMESDLTTPFFGGLRACLGSRSTFVFSKVAHMICTHAGGAVVNATNCATLVELSEHADALHRAESALLSFKGKNRLGRNNVQMVIEACTHLSGMASLALMESMMDAMARSVEARGRCAINDQRPRKHRRYDDSVVEVKLMPDGGGGLSARCDSHAHPDFHLEFDMPRDLLDALLRTGGE